MIGASTTVDAATFDLLNDGVTLARVFQDAPDNTPPPAVIVGDITASPFTDDPDDLDRRITVTVTTVTAGEERLPCTRIQDQVEAALSGARVERDGWLLSFRSLGSDAALIGDGSGYVGTTTAEVVAFRQD